jgi:cellobiose dehydrogenase (acceptor)
MTRGSNSSLSIIPPTGATNVTSADLIKSFKSGSHYVGTTKIGTKGDAGVVVDTNTKVYGTDNLFVVDASIHPDLPTGNTQAIVMVAAEAAAARILKLSGKPSSPATPGTGSESPAPPAVSPSTAPTAAPVESPAATQTATATATPSSPASSAAPVESAPAESAPAASPSAPVASAPAAAPAPAPAPATPSTAGKWERCGGIGHTGPTTCSDGWKCVKQNDYYSQCLSA